MKFNIIKIAILVSVLVMCSCKCKYPDLVVKDLDVTWTDTDQKVSFTVVNDGFYDAGEFMLYVNPEEDPVSPNHRPQLIKTVDGLVAGGLVEFNDLDLSGLAHPDNQLLGNVNNIVVEADPKHMIDECSDANNKIGLAVSAINLACWLKTGFESMTTGMQYNTLNTTFPSDDLTFRTVQFYWGSGTPSPGGFAEVQNRQNAGGTGNDIWTNNMNLEFQFPAVADYLTFRAGHYGGNMNLGINGVMHNFSDPAGINGMNLGGVTISTTGGTNSPGIWKFSGQINSFFVGGQEFALDDICIR